MHLSKVKCHDFTHYMLSFNMFTPHLCEKELVTRNRVPSMLNASLRQESKLSALLRLRCGFIFLTFIFYLSIGTIAEKINLSILCNTAFFFRFHDNVTRSFNLLNVITLLHLLHCYLHLQHYPLLLSLDHLNHLLSSCLQNK